MFGFALGTACLLGLIFVVKRGHCYSHGHWHGHHHHRGRYGVNRVLARLDTTPAQEKVIRQSLEEVRTEFFQTRSELRDTRRDLARALRGESIDQPLLQDVFARHEVSLGRVREAFVAALGKVHETLDPRQRELASELIESPPFAMGCARRHGAC